MQKRKLRSYVHGTQRGYAYGLTDGTNRYAERFVHCSFSSAADIDAAYRAASLDAASMLSTSRIRPDLIRDWTPLKGL